MATTKIWSAKGRIDHVINYAINDDKTAFTDVIEYVTHESKTIDVILVSTINCMEDDSIQAMMNTKKLFKDKKEIVCFHGYQSFQGYEIKETNKNVSLKHPDHKKFIRLSSLGDKYQIEEIQGYLSSRTPIRNDETIYDKKQFDIEPYVHKYIDRNLIGFQKTYIKYQYVLGIIPNSAKRKIKYSKELKKAIRYMDTISDQTILLCRNNISTLEQLKSYEGLLESELKFLLQNRQRYYNRIRRCTDTSIKDDLKSKAKSLTPKIRRLRKQIKLCTEIERRSLKMKEFESKEQVIKKNRGVKEYERN